MRAKYKGTVPSSFDTQIYTQVFTCYENKFKYIQHRLIFDVSTVKGFEFYKRDTKNHKKGDLKRVIVEKNTRHYPLVLLIL